MSELPPLPKPGAITCGDQHYHTEEQVYAYARTAIAQYEQDAKRYRWLVYGESGDALYDLLTGGYGSKQELDAAIDAAMSKESA